MEAAHDTWPAPSGAKRNFGPLNQLGDLSKADPDKISVIDFYAYQQISFITPTQLWDALKPGDAYRFVDCQENKEAKLVLAGAIRWDVKDDRDIHKEATFLRRKDNAKDYGYFQDSLFPTDPHKLPDIVIFNCQLGVNRSPMMAFWYMRYLLKTYPSTVPDRPNVRALKTRVYILEGGVSGLESSGTPRGLQSLLYDPSKKSGASGSGTSFASSPQPTNQSNMRRVTSGVSKTN
ncbi:hypothetical protein IWW34DRAFT_127074 [Fusarium oxysporum f. sp. albedinis]|nr:hypothetical protein IWW34DRAFT_127074 [Fusarium oxysporum f. sp. albedinis]KAJ0154894.1 putative transcription factor kapC [Fusarium oxysporum f. sp. albedinis]